MYSINFCFFVFIFFDWGKGKGREEKGKGKLTAGEAWGATRCKPLLFRLGWYRLREGSR